jgi:hypothetical protein
VLGRASVERHLVAVGVLEHGQVLRCGGPGVIHFIHREREGRSAVVLGLVETSIVRSCHVLILLCKRGEHFELAAENYGKAIASKGFLHTRKIGAIVPVVHFTMEGVMLSFECAKFSAGKGSETTGSMDMGDGRVDNGRLGRRKMVGQLEVGNLKKIGKILEMEAVS